VIRLVTHRAVHIVRHIAHVRGGLEVSVIISTARVTSRLNTVPLVALTVERIKSPTLSTAQFANWHVHEAAAGVSFEHEAFLAIEMVVRLLFWAAAVLWVARRTVPANVHSANYVIVIPVIFVVLPVIFVVFPVVVVTWAGTVSWITADTLRAHVHGADNCIINRAAAICWITDRAVPAKVLCAIDWLWFNLFRAVATIT
jgi:hypothetical protein